MNTNSNTYTIVYASVMVIIVAFLLAFVSSSLKDKQNENVALDKKKQILSALNVDLKGADAAKLYSELVLQEPILDYATGAVKAETGAFDVDSKTENAKPVQDRNIPLFVCQVDGATKYVLPVYGAGLWGPIWGYIALGTDMNTVKGIVLDHAGETPGLGAEITTPKHQAMYPGKTVYEGDAIVGVTLKKGGADKNNPHEVDAITGGTKTSDGVTAMISDCLNYYKPYFDAARAAATVEAESNTVNE